jgi:hypothetical protein
MDWNSNTLLFLETVTQKPRYCYSCERYYKCQCGVELHSFEHSIKNIKTDSVDTFFEYIETFSHERRKYFKTRDLLRYAGIDDNVWFKDCSCKLCLSGMYCKKILQDVFNQTLEINKKKCGYCNNKAYTCKDCRLPEKVLMYAIWIPSVPVKENPDNAVYTISLFEMKQEEYNNNNFVEIDMFHKMDWLLENWPIKAQFSIFSTINIYDEMMREQIHLANDLLREKTNVKHIFGELQKESTIEINPYFSGVKSADKYLDYFAELLLLYRNKEAVQLLEAKKNPHVDRPKKPKKNPV